MKQVSWEEALSAAQAAQGQIDTIYLHWSAGHYGQFFDDYHINIDQDGSVYMDDDMDLTANKPHTWHRNTGAIGVALACCAFATSENLGDEPPTDAQLDALARVVAVLCSGLGLPCDAAHVMTHAEAGNLDGYGPDQTWERWDLWFLHNGEAFGSGPDLIRSAAQKYMA